MIAILEKSEHNINFHQIVDFIEASRIRYALTINPTVYVSHIRQFWSTARIETTNEGTKILATIDGKPRTIFESSIRRNLKLNDEEGINSLPDAKLFENLALMRYNICQIKDLLFKRGEGSAIPTEPHHTPSPQAQQSPHYAPSSPSNPTATTKLIPTKTPTEIPTLRQYSRRATRTAQFKALSFAADEPASLLRDDSQGEAFLTFTSLDAGHDKENIIRISAFPYELTPRVTSLDADEGSMQQKLQELMEFCTGLQRQQTQMVTKIEAQELEISGLKARIKLLEDKDRGSAEPSGDDAPIKGKSMKIREEVGVERSTELGIMTLKKCVPPVARVSTVGIPTVNGLVPTVSAIFTTASVVTPYSRRPRGISTKDKGKEKVVESEEPKKKKLQEQIDAQVAKEIEEEIARENQRMNEQIARDAEIARIHAEEELKMMIEGLDRSNEVIARHLQEYEQSEVELTIREKIDLINELVKYQDHHAKILKYQAQQSKPLSKKEQKKFYMSISEAMLDRRPNISKE
uniref:Xylulose kinase-1 n=1 Tax=Tanacetum cinerariifolium TaxID=118510 RepID=A0A6L2MMV4_TANCI|nr:hypothetical protein [Tanacetum cinerariifolium]